MRFVYRINKLTMSDFSIVSYFKTAKCSINAVIATYKYAPHTCKLALSCHRENSGTSYGNQIK